MKLLAQQKCPGLLLIFYYFTRSQSIPTDGRSFHCQELHLTTFLNKSSVATATVGLLHADNGNLFLRLSWNLSRPGFQASFVDAASGSPVWNSEILERSTVLVFCFHQDGSFLVRSRRGSHVLRSSLVHGLRVTNFELLKSVLLQAGKAAPDDLQQKGIPSTISRNRKRFSSSIRRKRYLQENYPPSGSAIDEDGSSDSLTNRSSNATGASNLSSENMGSSSVNQDNGGHTNKKVLAMEIVFPVLFFLLVVFALCQTPALLRKRSQNKLKLNGSAVQSSISKKSIARQEEDEHLIESLLAAGLPPRFTYAEMDKATNGFAKKLGEGGYGAVFEGMWQESRARFAVKVFRDTTTTACRNGFCKEVLSIGETKHPNLVRLLGFCVEDEHRMLVYELMENGSLNKLLLGSKAAGERICNLEWERRVAIAVDTARALAFLHEEREQKRPVIHCDLKPENILLDENWVAKVSDFGLAKLLCGTCPNAQKAHEGGDAGEENGDKSLNGRQSPSVHYVSSSLSNLISSKGIRGTLGYLAPEWVQVDAGPSSITTASDVYSFGVVVLELLAGRRSMVPGLPFLLGQAFDLLASGDDVANLLDPQILEDIPPLTSPDILEEARNLAKVGLWCLQENPLLRPTMAAIINMLTRKEPVPVPPFCDYFAGSSHFFDEVDSRAQDSLFISHKEFETSVPISYDKGSWQMSILSGR